MNTSSTLCAPKGCGKMYCAIQKCGEFDESHSAYCVVHGRSYHQICSTIRLCPKCEKDNLSIPDAHAQGFKVGWDKGVENVFTFLSTQMTKLIVRDYLDLYMAWEKSDDAIQDEHAPGGENATKV